MSGEIELLPQRALTSVVGVDAAGLIGLSAAPALNPLSLTKWRKAVANARRGIAPARLCFVGDSGTRGSLSLASANDYSAGFPPQLARYYMPNGLVGNWDSIFGDGWVGNTILTLDTRLTFTGAATVAALNNNLVSFGGSFFEMTAAGTINFLPPNQVDTFKIYYAKMNGSPFAGGSFNYSVDAGGTTLVSTVAAQAIGTVTLSAGALGAHTLHTAWVSGQVEIIGIEAYNSAALNTITCLNGGFVGALAASWISTTQPWSAKNALMLAALAPDLTVIDLGTNEELNAISPATFTTNMQSLITAWKAVGDVVLKTHPPNSVATATQQAMINAIYALAAANNVNVIDTWQRLGSNLNYAALNTLGYYGDTNHLAALGYGDTAQQLATLLLT